MKDNDHLTLDEMITSIKWCHGILGGGSCEGCPNLVFGTLGTFGIDYLGECRCDIELEAMRYLETMRGGDGDGTGK